MNIAFSFILRLVVYGMLACHKLCAVPFSRAYWFNMASPCVALWWTLCMLVVAVGTQSAK